MRTLCLLVLLLIAGPGRTAAAEDWTRHFEEVIAWGLPETGDAVWVRPAIDPMKEEVRWWARSDEMPVCGAWLLGTKPDGRRLILMGESLHQVMSGGTQELFTGGGKAWQPADLLADSRSLTSWLQKPQTKLDPKDLRLPGHWFLLAARLHQRGHKTEAAALAAALDSAVAGAEDLKQAALTQLIEGLSEGSCEQFLWTGDFKQWAASLTKANTLRKEQRHPRAFSKFGCEEAPLAQWLAARVPADAAAYAAGLGLSAEDAALLRRLLTEPCRVSLQGGALVWLLDAGGQAGKGTTAVAELLRRGPRALPLLLALRGQHVPVPVLWEGRMNVTGFAKWVKELPDLAEARKAGGDMFGVFIKHGHFPGTLDMLAEVLLGNATEEWLRAAGKREPGVIAREWLDGGWEQSTAAAAWLSSPAGGAEGRKDLLAWFRKEPADVEAWLRQVLSYVSNGGQSVAEAWKELEPLAAERFLKARLPLLSNLGEFANRTEFLSLCRGLVSAGSVRDRLVVAASQDRVHDVSWNAEVKALAGNRPPAEIEADLLAAASGAAHGDAAAACLRVLSLLNTGAATRPLSPELRAAWRQLLADTRPVMPEVPLWELKVGDAAALLLLKLHGPPAPRRELALPEIFETYDCTSYYSLKPALRAGCDVARAYAPSLLDAPEGAAPPPFPWAMDAAGEAGLRKSLETAKGRALVEKLRTLTAVQRWQVAALSGSADWSELSARLRPLLHRTVSVQAFPSVHHPPVSDAGGKVLTPELLQSIAKYLRKQAAEEQTAYVLQILPLPDMTGSRLVVTRLTKGAEPRPLEVSTLSRARLRRGVKKAAEDRSDNLQIGEVRRGCNMAVYHEGFEMEGVGDKWEDFQNTAREWLTGRRSTSPLFNLTIVVTPPQLKD